MMRSSHVTKTTRRIRLLVILASALLAGLALAVYAGDYDKSVIVEADETFTLSEDKTIHGDLIVMGGQAEVLGTVEGNLVVVEGEAKLGASATIRGKALKVRGSIDRHPEATVEGEEGKLAAQDLADRLAGIGKQEEAAGEPPAAATESSEAAKVEHKGNLVNFGDTRTVVPAGEIRIGDVGAFGGSVEIEGEVRGEVVCFGGPVVISGEVTGDVGSFGGTVTLKSASHVHGDVVTFGGKVDRQPGSQVDGDVGGLHADFMRLPLRDPWGGHLRASVAIRRLGKWITETVLVLIMTLVVVLIAPNGTRVVADCIQEKPGEAAVHGLLVGPVLFLVCTVLAITVVGIAAIPLLFLLLIIAGILGTVGVYLALGRKIAQSLKWSVASVLGLAVLGALALRLVAVLQVAPYLAAIAVLVAVAVLVFALGGALMTGFGSDPRCAFITGRLVGRNRQAQSVPPQEGPPAGQ